MRGRIEPLPAADNPKSNPSPRVPPEPLEGSGMLPYTEENGVAVEIPALDPAAQELHQKHVEQRTFVRAYLMMAAGLLLSAAVAGLCVERAQIAEEVAANQIWYAVVFAVEVFCVVFLRKVVPSLGKVGAFSLFFAYSALNGVSFSIFLLFVPTYALATAFLLAAVMFAGTAIYGWATHQDLAGLNGMLAMFVVAFVLLGALRLGWHATGWQHALSVLFVFAFVALSAWRADEIRGLVLECDPGKVGWEAPVLGALLIYLDFINLYLIVRVVIWRNLAWISSRLGKDGEDE